MKNAWLRLSGALIAVVTAYLLFLTIQRGFVPFEFASFPMEETLIPVDGEVGHGVSRALWGQRQLDLVALAFLLFVTAACCTAILRPEGGEDT